MLLTKKMVTMQMRITAMFLSFLAWFFLTLLTLQNRHNNVVHHNHLPEPLVYPGVEKDQGGEGYYASAYQTEHVHVVSESKEIEESLPKPKFLFN